MRCVGEMSGMQPATAATNGELEWQESCLMMAAHHAILRMRHDHLPQETPYTVVHTQLPPQLEDQRDGELPTTQVLSATSMAQAGSGAPHLCMPYTALLINYDIVESYCVSALCEAKNIAGDREEGVRHPSKANEMDRVLVEVCCRFI